MKPRHLSVVGFGVGLLGCLAILAASLSLALSEGAVGGALFINSLVPTAVFYNGLTNASTDDEFDWEPSLALRINYWFLAVMTAAVGVLMFAVGIVSLSIFG